MRNKRSAICRAQFEALDVRRMMAVTNFLVTGTEKNDEIDVFHSREGIQIWVKPLGREGKYTRITTVPHNFQVTIKGLGGADRIHVDGFRDGGEVKVDAGAGNDQIDICSWGKFSEDINGPVTVVGGAGNDQVLIDDSRSRTPQFDDVYRIKPGAIEWGFAEDNGGAHYESQVYYDASLEYAKLKGTHETSTFHVVGTSAGTKVDVEAGNGDNTIDIGAGDLDSNIKGSLTINANSGNDRLTFNDSADAGADAYRLQAVRLQKANTADVTFFNVEQTRLDADSYANTIQVEGVVNPTRINGGGGEDRFEIGLGKWAGVRSDITLDGGAGADTAIVDDTQATAGAWYTVSQSSLWKQGVNTGTILTSSISTIGLRGGQGADRFTVKPGLGAELQVRSGAQNDGSKKDSIEFAPTGSAPFVDHAKLATTYHFANSRPVVVSGIEIEPSFGGSITGRMFSDRNRNGRHEQLIEPWTTWMPVYIDFDGDKKYDADEPLTRTNGNGRYLFAGLAAGTYTVRVAMNGIQVTTPSNDEYTAILRQDEQEEALAFGIFSTVQA